MKPEWIKRALAWVWRLFGWPDIPTAGLFFGGTSCSKLLGKLAKAEQELREKMEKKRRGDE